MISFAEHSKNADHFNRVGQEIIQKFDNLGLFKTFMWSGWAPAKLGWSLVDITLNPDGTVTLSASYYCPGGDQAGDITIPASLMNFSTTDAWEKALALHLAARLDERDAALQAKAAHAAREQRERDEAELARLQAKLSAAGAASVGSAAAGS